MTPLQARFRDPVCELLEKHGITNVGYWTNMIGGRDDQLVYMVGFEDLGQRERAWDSYGADPEWHRVRAETEANGRLVRYRESRILSPTDFSPLR
ncbi:MAG: NIPSNAP family protein [Streptosporangiaceae bacterium]|nr:NIPSNAP family protein [Streptosporangiaceae bacterium]